MKSFLLTTVGGLLILLLTATLSVAQEAKVIYQEDFESWPELMVDVDQRHELYNGDVRWVTQNWAGDSFLTSGVGPDPVEGDNALYRKIEVYNWWYGGGFFGPRVPLNGSSDDLADYELTVSLYAESSNATGSVGVSVLSFDADGNRTGAAYASVPVLPMWFTHTLNLADMLPGIPQEGEFVEEPFVPTSASVQVIVWVRTGIPEEEGWPTGLDGQTYTIYVDDLSFTGPSGGSVEPPDPVSLWADFTVQGGFKNTGELNGAGFGWIVDTFYPFIYSDLWALATPDGTDPGWLFIWPDSSTLESVYAFVLALDGWIWMNPALGPIYYRFQTDSWEQIGG